MIEQKTENRNSLMQKAREHLYLRIAGITDETIRRNGYQIPREIGAYRHLFRQAKKQDSEEKVLGITRLMRFEMMLETYGRHLAGICMGLGNGGLYGLPYEGTEKLEDPIAGRIYEDLANQMTMQMYTHAYDFGLLPASTPATPFSDSSRY